MYNLRRQLAKARLAWGLGQGKKKTKHNTTKNQAVLELDYQRQDLLGLWVERHSERTAVPVGYNHNGGRWGGVAQPVRRAPVCE